MHHLQTLGALNLKGPDGRELRAILAQPKRLALLVYLCIARPRGYHRRDTLLAVFWPDLDATHARGALNRAVYYVRRALGDGAVRSRGDDELEVAEDQVWCDVREFEAALDNKKLEDALALYRGDLLDGFFLADAPDFERWLESERSRLRERGAESASRLATAAQAAGNLPLAIHWARRGAELRPYDETTFRRLACLLDRGGDRSAALLAYDQFVARLRDDLEVEPSAETASVIGEMRRRDQRAKAEEPPREPVPRPGPSAEPSVFFRRHRAGAIALGAVMAATAVAVWIREARSTPHLDPNVVAVLPFRVTGSPSVTYLREGIVDLLAARLNGERGVRAADPQASMIAWNGAERSSGAEPTQEATLAIARHLGADRLITGSIVGTANRVIVNALLLDVRHGGQRASATVQGPQDSLLTLIDELTAQLLAREAGEEEQRLATLTSTSLPALREYLAGQAAYRRGAYGEASHDYQRALQLDSSFALAAMGLVMAANWTGEDELSKRAYDVALHYHTRLSTRDSVILSVTVAANVANPAMADYIAAGERAAALTPERPETWDLLAEARFHAGAVLGSDRRRAHDRAAAEFAKALEFDSGYAPALSHLVEYAVETRDTAAAHRFGALYLAVDSAGDLADYIRWLVATVTVNSAELQTLRLHMPQMRIGSLLRIIGDGQLEAIGLDDVDRAADVLRTRSLTGEDAWQVYSALHNLALNRGKPRAALALTEGQREFEPMWRETDRKVVLDGLFGGGDTTASAQAVRRLIPFADGPLAGQPPQRDAQYRDICVVELWRLAHAASRIGSRQTIRLAAVPANRDPARTAASNAVCTAVLDAAYAIVSNSHEREKSLAALDAVLERGPSAATIGYSFGSGSWDLLNLEAARLHEASSDLAGALAAVRRRAYDWSSPLYLSTFLREEGRLAVLNGDRAEAISAYQHYLALRSDPEPGTAPEVAQVRAEISRLLREPRD